MEQWYQLIKNHRITNNMAYKFVVFFAALAYANAGLLPAAAPVAYSPASAVSHAYISQPAVAVAAPLAAAPVAIHAPAYGTSQQNVLRSYGGNQAISTYSKAVDSAFSSVRKYDTRITNDALSVYAHAAPAVATYAAPAVASYAAPAYSTYSHAAPAYSTYAHAAPAYSTYAHAAPAVASYAAPAYSTYAHAAPVVAKAAVPVAYSPAVAVSHMSFSGLGVNYGW